MEKASIGLLTTSSRSFWNRRILRGFQARWDPWCLQSALGLSWDPYRLDNPRKPPLASFTKKSSSTSFWMSKPPTPSLQLSLRVVINSKPSLLAQLPPTRRFQRHFLEQFGNNLRHSLYPDWNKRWRIWIKSVGLWIWLSCLNISHWLHFRLQAPQPLTML